MKTLSQTLIVVSLLIPAFSLSEAARRAHKPWFSSSHVIPEDVVGGSRRSVNMDPRLGHSGVTPFVAKDAPSQASANKFVQRALDYKGTRYRFGGTSKKGLDCSGLVHRVVSDLKLKLDLPRNSKDLYQKGEKVTLSEMRPGDLVFFKNTYRHGISHVGIYMGKNRFVHSSPAHGVTVTQLSEPYYQLHYAGARRIL